MSTLRVAIVALAVYHLVIGLLMVVTPHLFFTDIGPFGHQNDHYLRDTATYNFAFAAALAVAWRRPSWRLPVLFCVTVQFALHTINHLADIGEAHPYWLGPADFASLLVATVLLARLTLYSARTLEVSR
jgi:hypothetical protein